METAAPSPLLTRREHWLLFAVAFAILVAAALPEPFGWPTYWDASLGPVTQAVWLQENGFDYGRLMRDLPGYGLGGPKVYLWSVYPPLMAAVMRVTGSPAGFLAVMHLATLVMAALAVVTAAGLARRLQPRLPLWTAPALLLTQPFFLTQSQAVNLEMPVLLASLLALRAFTDHRWQACALWLLAGFAVKASVVPLSLALTAAYLVAHARDPRAVVRALSLASPFLLNWTLRQVELLHSYAPFGDGGGGMTHRLADWRAWVAFNWLAFTRTPDLMAAALAVLAAAVVRGARALRGPRAGLEIPALLAAGLALVPVTNILIRNPLPRYVFSYFPLMVLGVLALTDRLPRRLALALTLLWAGLNLANLRGALPRAITAAVIPAGGRGEHDGNNGHILERSLEFRDDLGLQRAIAAELAKNHAGRVVVTSWPLIHHLRSPWFGYVETPREVMSSHRPVMQWAGVRDFWRFQAEHPDHEGRRPEDFVWVWTDNVFSYPMPPRENMELLSTVRHAGREAVIFRYNDWPVSLLPIEPKPSW